MASLRDTAACIGVTGDFSVVRDFYGYLSKPGDLSVLTQVSLLQGRYVDLNLIRVGIESFTPADEADIDNAVQYTRDHFEPVGLGVGRILRFFVTTADANGHDHIETDGEAEALTHDWTVRTTPSTVPGPEFPHGDRTVANRRALRQERCAHERQRRRDGGQLDHVHDGPARGDVPRSSRELLRQREPDVEHDPKRRRADPAAGVGHARPLLRERRVPRPMPVRIQPPFEVTARIDIQAAERHPTAELARLRRIVLGQEDGLPRAAAMALLAETDYPNVHRDLESVLLNDVEASGTRCHAAMTLWRLGSVQAAAVLERALAVKDARVLAAVFTALGRVGPQASAPAIAQARRRAKGLARARADFAATLIAHRFGLPGHVVPPPSPKEFLAVPSGAGRTFRVTRADAAETELGLRSLAHEPVGVDLSERDAYLLRCDGNDWLLLLSADLAMEGASGLTARKAVAAVVASKQEATGLYSTRFLVLTSPVRGSRSAAVTVHRGTGELAFAGEAKVEGDEVEFAVRAVKAQGAFPVRFSGFWTPGRLAAREAMYGPFVSVRRAPSPGIRP